MPLTGYRHRTNDLLTDWSKRTTMDWLDNQSIIVRWQALICSSGLTSGLFIFYLPIFAAPSGPPLNVAVTDITSRSMNVSWDPPVEPNGKIVGYKVIYYEIDNQERKLLNVPEQGYTIKNLKPFRTYRISVACKSSGGIGQHSVEIENKTLPEGESLVSSFAFFRALSRKALGSAAIKYDQIKSETVFPLDPHNMYACVVCHKKSHS